MKQRPDGFLKDLYNPDTEVGDYVRELHEYLWRFVRVRFPWASGTLDKYVDAAIEDAERKP